MSQIKFENSVTAQWHELICEAEKASHCQLEEDLESYLVFLLMRFFDRPDIAGRVLALDYLLSLEQTGKQQAQSLRDVGDHCLLYSGFFPKQASRRRVKISYFVDLGRSAYNQLAIHASEKISRFYVDLAEGFVSLMDVLQAAQQLGLQEPLLAPLEAFELWQDTGSKRALSQLEGSNQSQVLLNNSTRKH